MSSHTYSSTQQYSPLSQASSESHLLSGLAEQPLSAGLLTRPAQPQGLSGVCPPRLPWLLAQPPLLASGSACTHTHSAATDCTWLCMHTPIDLRHVNAQLP